MLRLAAYEYPRLLPLKQFARTSHIGPVIYLLHSNQERLCRHTRKKVPMDQCELKDSPQHTHKYSSHLPNQSGRSANIAPKLHHSRGNSYTSFVYPHPGNRAGKPILKSPIVVDSTERSNASNLIRHTHAIVWLAITTGFRAA